MSWMGLEDTSHDGFKDHRDAALAFGGDGAFSPIFQGVVHISVDRKMSEPKNRNRAYECIEVGVQHESTHGILEHDGPRKGISYSLFAPSLM